MGKDEIKGAKILAGFKAEWEKPETHANGNRSHGCQKRYRRKLEREAGYSYNEAYFSILAVWEKEKGGAA